MAQQLFTPSMIKEVSKQLIPRARMQIPYQRIGMTEAEFAMFKERSKLKASVLIPLINYRNKASILFTQRTDKVSTHQNEISFPGGHADHSDMSILHSALREFHEELGVHFKFNIENETIADQFHTASDSKDNETVIKAQPFLSNSMEPGVNSLELDILGTLFESVPSKHGTSVQPIVAYIRLSKLHEIKRSDIITDLLDPDRYEVQRVFCVPVDELTNPRFQKEEHLERRGGSVRYKVPSSPCGDIWGFTGFLTQQLINHVLLPSFRLQAR